MDSSSSAQARLQFDHSPETLAQSEIISAVSTPDLGLRLRAIHAIAQLNPTISLPTLFIICQPDNPCLTSAWLSCAELCNIACRDCSLLPQVLPSILSMGAATNQRCSRTVRIPVHKLISNPDTDAASKKSLASFASSLNIEYVTTRKRPGAALERARPAARNPAEDRLIHERLDSFPLQTQIELIVRCVLRNLPNIESSPFKPEGTGFKKILQLLLEQETLTRDPRLRDPRLRNSVVITESQIASDLQLISSAFERMAEHVQKSGQASALLVKKAVPEIPIRKLDDDSRQKLKNLAFERMMASCSRSRVTETVITQMLVKYDVSRISSLLELFKSSPVAWLEVLLQLGYVLIAAGLSDLYVQSFMTAIEPLWNAPAGTLSRFLCTCAVLPDEAVQIIDQVCQSDNDLKRTVALFAFRDVIMKRPADKSKILHQLLTYGGSSNASLRNTVVALLTHQLLPLGGSVEEQIIEYATQLFSTISDPFEVEILEKVNATVDSVQQVGSGSAEEDHAEDGMSIDGTDNEQQINQADSKPPEPNDTDGPVRSTDVKLQDGSEHAAEINTSVDSTEPNDPEILTEDMDTTDEKEAGPAAADALIEAEASRRLDLYLSLCSKRHDMFPKILSVFSLVSGRGTAVRACFHKNIPKLVRLIGSNSPVLIEAFKQSPSGSEPLVLHALHILTDGVEDLVSPALIEAAQTCYARCRDARFLIPVLSGMKRAQVLEALPHIIALPKIHVDQAFKLLLSPGAPVSPSEVLVRLHIIAPTPDHPLLRKVMDAIQLCIFNKDSYNEKVLAVVLQQVVERNPIPVLFMRTLIQVLAVYPLLTEFAITILARLVNKRIWDLANLELWQGFIVCCMRTAPHSYPIMLQLPSSKLAQLIDRSKEPNKLRVELARFVQNSRVEVRRSIQSLLGLTRRLR